VVLVVALLLRPVVGKTLLLCQWAKRRGLRQRPKLRVLEQRPKLRVLEQRAKWRLQRRRASTSTAGSRTDD